MPAIAPGPDAFLRRAILVDGMAFAQLTYRESLRDGQTWPLGPRIRSHHMGFAPARSGEHSTLAGIERGSMRRSPSRLITLAARRVRRRS